jgi:hypothetical protein
MLKHKTHEYIRPYGKMGFDETEGDEPFAETGGLDALKATRGDV